MSATNDVSVISDVRVYHQSLPASPFGVGAKEGRRVGSNDGTAVGWLEG